MKPQRSYHGTIEGDLSGQKIEMDLDLSPEGRAHLLSLMTDLYSDQELAIIREYSTNARDSHIDSGQPNRPIEVTTPNALSQHLVIRDYGIGLSINDLETIYSKYGASTKRGSDDVNGMLGLGGKSALTYSSQFMVTAVKSGVKSQIVVNRNEDGRGVMEVVDTRSTDEPNGVEIKIPAKEDNELEHKAQRFFYYWSPGTVLLNGQRPDHMMSEPGHTKIGDSAYAIRTNDYWRRSATDVIVMGGVAYPTQNKPFTEAIGSNNYTSNNYNTHTVVYVEMGEVTFAPSREALSYTPRTQAAIQRIAGTLRQQLSDSIMAQLDSAANYAHAYKVWISWGRVLGIDKLPAVTYKGHKLERHIRAHHSIVTIGGGRWNRQTGKSGNAGSTSTDIDLSELLSDKVLVITNYTNSTAPSATAKRKLNAYMDTLTDRPRKVLLFNTMPGAPWTNDVVSIDWQTINSIKLSNGNSGGGRVGTIPVLLYKSGRNHYAVWEETKALDQTKPIVYMSPADIGNGVSYYNIEAIASVLPDVQMVSLGRNRWTKFLRENPKAITWNAYKSYHVSDAVKATLTAEQIWSLEYDRDYHNCADRYSKSNDPTFARLTKVTVDSSVRRLYNGPTGIKEFDTDYPLLAYNQGSHRDHEIMYINMIHATKGKS